MSVRHEPWPPGTPAWTDLTTPDRLVAHDFYGAVLGWAVTDGPPEMGYYANAQLNGEVVAGIGQEMPGQENEHPAWTTYLATADIDATAAAVAAAGGTVIVPPMAVMEFGSMAVFADPTGAIFGVWQSGTHTGETIANEPGAVIWNEVMSPDFEKAKAFYGAVFGYTFTDMSDEGFQYASFEVDGVTRGGIGGIGPDMPGVPPHWLTYFCVADTDESVGVVTAHGGAVVRAPWDSPYGRMAIVTGPAGEPFAFMSAVPSEDESATGSA